MTTATLRRARAAALLASVFAVAAVLTACTGRNDGRKDPYGNASMGAGGDAPAGPRPGQNTDTTMIPAAAGAPTGNAAGAAAPAPAAGTAPAAATPASPAPKAP
jgi:hypothetical protein